MPAETKRIDRVIRHLFPGWQVKRDHARAWSEYFRIVEENSHQFASASRTFNSRDKSAGPSSYQGAVGSRVDQTWTESQSSTGLRHLRKANLSQLRDRARQLDRDNMIASAVLDRAAENIVSSGFKFQARSADDDWNKRVEGLWRGWEDECDVRGMLSLPEITEQVFRSTYRDGDCGVNLIPDGRIEIIEGDMIASPLKLPDGIRVIDGVQINRAGAPTNFWVTGFKNGKNVSLVLDAENFIFLPRIKRARQIRGEPVFSAAFPLFDQLDGYIDATVIASRMAAMFGLIIKGESKGPYASMPQQSDASGASRPNLTMEPGMIKRLDGYADIHQIKPEQPHQQFSEFVATLIRFAGLSLGLPLELVMLDFSRSNYSNTRGVLLQTQRSHRKIQNWLSRNFLSRVFRWRMGLWLAEGAIPEREDSYSHRWIPPGWSWIDPQKEMEGVAMALDMGMTTRTDEAARQGRDWEEMVMVRVSENAKLREAGITEVRSRRTRDIVDDDQGEPE